MAAGCCTSRCGSTRAAACRRTSIPPWRSASRSWPGGRASSPEGSGGKPAHDEVAHVLCHARPPSSLQEFLEDAAALGRAGKLTRHALPKSPSALLQAAVMAHHYRDMVELGF